MVHSAAWLNHDQIQESPAEEPSSWPAVVWTQGSRVCWIIDEGLNEATVMRVANMLKTISLDEFRSLVDNEHC